MNHQRMTFRDCGCAWGTLATLGVGRLVGSEESEVFGPRNVVRGGISVQWRVDFTRTLICTCDSRVAPFDNILLLFEGSAARKSCGGARGGCWALESSRSALLLTMEGKQNKD